MSRRQHKPRGVQNSPLVEAEITSLTLEGKGVARVNGKTVFIDGALPERRWPSAIPRIKLIMMKVG